MSITSVSGAQPDRWQEPWQPTVTEREAARLGIAKNDYRRAALIGRTAVEEHQAAGTHRSSWEPAATQNEHLARQFVDEGRQLLAGRLDAEADPSLDEAQARLEAVRILVGETVQEDQPLVTPETGTSHSLADAVALVQAHDAKIERDESAGRRLHRRSRPALKTIGRWAPWIEACGFLAFVTYYLNVPLLQPWLDWLGWSFALSMVVVIVVGQNAQVHHAALSHNHGREALADGNRHEAERAMTQRNRHLVAVAVIALAITCALIMRGVAALGDSEITTTLVMIFLAIVTGLVLPTLAYLGAAFDGSRVSRERDELVALLDADLDAWKRAIEECHRDLVAVSGIRDTLNNKTFPDICTAVQDRVDGVYEVHGLVRLLIGGLTADPPAKALATVAMDADGNIKGQLGTTIPGAGSVSLAPLLDRCRRLAMVEADRTTLLAELQSLPAHPWGSGAGG